MRKLMLCASLLTLGAVPAHAGGTVGPNSECPGLCIYIVGDNGAVGDPVGRYCVSVRDFNNRPIVNSSVVIDFSRCDVQLCTDQKDPDVIVDCIAQTVRKLTDVNGQACFIVLGKSRPNLDCGGQGSLCAKVFADGVALCQANTPIFNLVNHADGRGLGADDLAAWLSGFFCGTNPLRLDYTCDGIVGASDFARWLSVFFAGGSSLNCPSPKCPSLVDLRKIAA